MKKNWKYKERSGDKGSSPAKCVNYDYSTHLSSKNCFLNMFPYIAYD